MRTHCPRIAFGSLLLLFGLVAALGTGCPAPSTDYDTGYSDGFAQDDWYWSGFHDGFDTESAAPIYYQGGAIPAPQTPEQDRGYWDGVWAAYNDGYFLDYDDAFTIGFSEGYDTAFYADYLDFLQTDQHVEYANGGWGDGYNDGFSEGRVFGANDYEQGLPFDWLDAILDYRSGTDLNFDEIGVGTGAFGPVILYEYGTDPSAKAARAKANDVPQIRQNVITDFRRDMPQDVLDELNVLPATTPRGYDLTLTTTWLERIDDFVAAGGKSGAESIRLQRAK